MNAIFGVFCRDADCLPTSVRENIQIVIHNGHLGDCRLWEGDVVCLGLSESGTLPVSNTASRSKLTSSDNFVFISVGRIDNSSELYTLLNIPESERASLLDYDLMRRAYCRWGKEASVRMYGDWAFAAWHPTERQLVLSRGHYGSVPLYYHINQNILAFASSRQMLLALKLSPSEADELWLAQHLISWPASYGERTPHKFTKCLPPAHYLVAASDGCYTHQYWHPEDSDEIRFSRREEYAEMFRSVFDEAVRCRLRSNGPIAATLSGGLDSGAVAATAARLLSAKGGRLTAFTSVPRFDSERYVLERFGDEFPFAKATADYVGNIDLHPLVSAEISPVTTIRQALHLGCVPCHGAGNLYWLMDVQRSARAAGYSILLTGAAGNGGVSWTGDKFSQTWSFLLSHVARRTLALELGKRIKQRAKSALPINLLVAWQQRRMEHQSWYRRTAINPDFARRIRLLEQRLHDPDERPALSPREQRARILMLGKSVFGAYSTEIAAFNGLELRDPTADARVLDFVLAVPDHIFMDPKTGIDRWLIREAMKGRLPDKVRLNRSRGQQGGDMVPRLRGCAAEVEDALDELASGPAAEYVDVSYMRQVWRTVQTEDTPQANAASKQILLRGIMAGLFVNSFHE